MSASSAAKLIVGANRGIGLALTEQLLKQGDPVFATHRADSNTTKLKQLANQTAKLTLIACDPTQEHDCITLAKQLPKLQRVINCVGVLHDGLVQPERRLQDISSNKLMRYIEINTIPSMLLAKHLLTHLKHSMPSQFAVISAKVGSIEDNRLGGWYGYRASKAALNMFIKTLSIELKRECPLTCAVALHPGTTDTALSQPFQKNVPPEKLFSTDKTANLLLNVLDQLTAEHSGRFYGWNGQEIPW